MIELKRILVTTDFSKASDAALQQGLLLAAAFGSRLYLLHVVDLSGETWSGYVPSVELLNAVEQRRSDAQKRLEKIEGQGRLAKDQMIVGTASGHPADEILRFAEREEIDLIVCGTHGRRGWDHLAMGSVAERIVRLARRPVLTVHANPDAERAAA